MERLPVRFVIFNGFREKNRVAFVKKLKKASVTFSSDNKKFKRTPKSDKVLGDQTKKL